MLHIVFQTSDVHAIQEAIKLDTSLEGDIVEIKDEFAVGPIANIYEPEGYQARREWWKQVLEFSPYVGEHDIIDDKLTVHNLIKRLNEDASLQAWIWMGQNQHDVCGYYWLMSQLKDGKKELFIVDDKDGTPTFTHDFAKNVKVLIQHEYWGLYNMVCGGETSRYEVTEELLKILNLHEKIKLTPVKSDYFKDIYFAERPASERLVNLKLTMRNLNLMQDWKISLREYISHYYQGYLD